jgi:hypothetical protein
MCTILLLMLWMHSIGEQDDTHHDGGEHCQAAVHAEEVSLGGAAGLLERAQRLPWLGLQGRACCAESRLAVGFARDLPCPTNNLW